MKQIIYTICTVALISLGLNTHAQSISENTSYPTATRIQCEYQFTGNSGPFQYWILPENCICKNNGVKKDDKQILGYSYLWLQWKNVEASADKSKLYAYYNNDQGYPVQVLANVGPFQLSLPAPSFMYGTTKNIPCHATQPVVISLNPYINTEANGIDQNSLITSHFRWTLPSGWQTTGGQTGTFNATESISVFPPVSSSPVIIQVQPFAESNQGNQYGTIATLQITRNLEAFSIDGPTTVTYNSINRYTVPSYPGISYSWQLPLGWTGQSATNYIDVTAGCGSGNIGCTMTGCNGSQPSTKAISFNVDYPGSVISGPSDICSSGAYSVNNIPTGATVTWSLSKEGIVSTPSPVAGFSTSLTALTEGIVFLRANITYSCGSYTISKTINTQGLATEFGIQASVPCQPGNIVQTSTFTAVPSSPSLTYHWRSVRNGISTNITGSEPSITKKFGLGSYQIFAWASSVCGETEEAMANINVIACGSLMATSATVATYSLTITPNPASSETTLELISSDGKELAPNLVWDMEIYDSMQTMKTKNPMIRGNKKNISTSGWKNGVYLVRVKFKDEIISGKLLVNP